jgi:hypothetical protein
VSAAIGVIARRDRDLGGDVGRLSACRTQPVPAGVDEDPVEPRLESGPVTKRVPLAPRLDERVVGRVLRLDRIAEDRPRETVRPVEMLVGQPDEGRVAESAIDDAGACAFCQFECLGTSVHDDMTREACQTFSTPPRGAVDRTVQAWLASTVIDINRG